MIVADCLQHPGGVVSWVVRRSIFVRFDAERRGRADRVCPLMWQWRVAENTTSSGGVDWSVRNWQLSVQLCSFQWAASGRPGHHLHGWSLLVYPGPLVHVLFFSLRRQPSLSQVIGTNSLRTMTSSHFVSFVFVYTDRSSSTDRPAMQ